MANNTWLADDSAFRALVDRSMEELRLKTQGHATGWGLGTSDRWDLDQEDGRLIFKSKKLTAAAPAQIIGSYSTSTGTWLWAWDNPCVLEPLQAHARQVREYGETHGITALITREFECSEADAWQITALACHLCEAQGAYRGPAGTTLVFMTFGKVTLSKPTG